MSEQRGKEEREDEGENTETNLRPAGDTEEQPPEDDREPGSNGEEAQSDSSTTDHFVDCEDVLEATEEAESQTDLPHDAEQPREPQRRETVGNSTATVKVVLVPEGHVMTVAFAIGLRIQELKLHLAAELRVPAEVLQISLDGRLVKEQQSLMELGVRPHGSTRMEMSSTDPTNHPLRPLRPPEQDNMPDVITVRVQTDEDVFQQVVVEIERPPQQKAFLGGYRHRLTGVEYHNAAVQTLPKRRPERRVAVFSRDTQTVELKSQAQQCPVDASTQITGIDDYDSCKNDKLVTAGEYVTADEYHDRRLKAVICLQSYARRWLAHQAVDRLKTDRDRRLAWMDMRERKLREEREEQLRDRRKRWMNPQKREDFNLLYQALEKWRCEEETRINTSLCGAERKAALCLLLKQEAEMIAAIGRHRIGVQSDNYDKTVRNFLDKSAAPHRWFAADGRPIEMDNEHTIRARELRDLYEHVNLFTVGREQRCNVLTTLRHTVKEHDCPLTRDIVDLVDREVDLMDRGIKAASLVGLRKRISTLFLQFIKTPAFNPQVAKVLKVPQNPSELKGNMFLCRGCNRYLQSDNFSLSAIGPRRPIGRCRDCAGLDNIARTRDDLSCYKTILMRLRADEQQLSVKNQIPILLQAKDMQHLVKEVWASCSALSASSDLYNLVFVRWERQRDWSPWNCILLSKEETSAHLEVEDVHKAYEAALIRDIEQKHRQARRHFSQITTVTEYLDSQRSAVLGNHLVSKSITMATGQHTTDTPCASAR